MHHFRSYQVLSYFGITLVLGNPITFLGVGSSVSFPLGCGSGPGFVVFFACLIFQLHLIFAHSILHFFLAYICNLYCRQALRVNMSSAWKRYLRRCSVSSSLEYCFSIIGYFPPLNWKYVVGGFHRPLRFVVAAIFRDLARCTTLPP